MHAPITISEPELDSSIGYVDLIAQAFAFEPRAAGVGHQEAQRLATELGELRRR